VTVVIPTLNEEEAIGPLIDEIKEAGYGRVLVVDGYSKDKTVKIAAIKEPKWSVSMVGVKQVLFWWQETLWIHRIFSSWTEITHTTLKI